MKARRTGRSCRGRARARRTWWSSCSTTSASPTSAATAPTIATPNIDRLAAGGLRYTNFHTTALCSPTRACAAHRPQPPRGRHARRSPNWNTGFPNCTGTHHQERGDRRRDAARRRLRHLRGRQVAPDADGARRSPRGPVRPVAAGSAASTASTASCEGETDQFYPELIRDNHPIEPPRTPERATTSPRTSSTRRSAWSHDQQVADPGQAVLPVPRVRRDARAAPGAAGVPRQVPRPVRRRLGRRSREQWFARQKELGIVPPDTELAPRNPGVEPWDELLGGRAAPRAPAAGGVRRLPRAHRRADRPAGRLPDGDRRARQHAVRADVRQRRQPGGRPARRASTTLQLLQRHARDIEESRRAARRHRRRRTSHNNYPVGLGAGRQHAAASGTSRTPTAAASATR